MKRRRPPGPLARRPGARGRKAAVAGRFGGFARRPRADVHSAALDPKAARMERELRLALGRVPFRIERVWRAIKAGADLAAGFGGHSGLWLSVHLESMRRAPGTGRTRRDFRALSGWAPGRKPRDRGCPEHGLAPLWRLLAALGADIDELDESGEGFERWAISRGLYMSPPTEAALAWWKSVGRGPWRSGNGADNLMEAAVARGAHFLDAVARAWPDECSNGLCCEALGRAGSLVLERERLFAQRWELIRDKSIPPPLVVFKLPNSEISWAASSIAQGRPEAIRADRSLSSAMRELNGPGDLLDRIEALESAAIAEREREALGAIARPGLGGAKPQGL